LVTIDGVYIYNGKSKQVGYESLTLFLVTYSVEGIQVKYVCQKNLFDFNIIFVFVLTL